MNRDSPTRPSVQVFEPRPSTWALIEDQTIEEERTDIKELIGSSLIEETVDLHREVNALLDIWRDFREETDRQTNVTSLPEPPNVRENLIKQIQLFVKLIQEKSARERNQPREVLSPYQLDVVASICEAKGQESTLPERPQTACSARDGRQTPLRPHSNYNSRPCSSQSSIHFADEQEVKSSEEIEKLADIIREDLEEERSALRLDIEFLQQCLMDESAFSVSISTQNEPTLKELKDIGLKLEKELVVADTIPKENVAKHAPRQQSEDNVHKTKIHSSKSNPSKIVPSPPSSAPTSKSRTNMGQRKHLTAKVVQLTTDDKFTANQHETQSRQSRKTENHHITPSETSDFLSGRRKITTVTTTTVLTTTTTVIAPCIVSSIGSNSRKLRQVVLNSREKQT